VCVLFETLARARRRRTAATVHAGVNEEVGQERFAGRVRHSRRPPPEPTINVSYVAPAVYIGRRKPRVA
jgi:hypothetical protein